MAKIAIDIDDTLYDFGSIAKDALFRIAQENEDKEMFKGMYSPATQWRLPNDYAGPEAWMEAIKICHQPEVIKAQPPFPGAVETVNALHDYGHSIMYISNRSGGAERATYQWLGDQGFPISPIGTELVCTMKDKLPMMHQCQYLIDDRPRTLILFTRDYDWNEKYRTKERKAFGRQTPYNENLTDVPNIYLTPSWVGIGYYLARKGLLDEQPYEALTTDERERIEAVL